MLPIVNFTFAELNFHPPLWNAASSRGRTIGIGHSEGVPTLSVLFGSNLLARALPLAHGRLHISEIAVHLPPSVQILCRVAPGEYCAGLPSCSNSTAQL